LLFRFESTGSPLCTFQRRIFPSAPPVTSVAASCRNTTDQTGKPFGSRELAGKVWVADFIFTSCQGSCPLLSERMEEVGKRARHLGPDFHLVSISVDPERDTPERLAEYAGRYGANPIAWSFLTGPEAAIQAPSCGLQLR